MTSTIPFNPNKRFKPGKIIDIDIFHKISQQVADLQITFTERIGQLESKVDLLMSLYTALTDKLDNDAINSQLKSNMIKDNIEIREHDCCKENLLKLANIESMFEKFIEVSTADCHRYVKHEESTSSHLTVLLPQKKPSVRAQLSLDSSIQAITLNSESDFPEGSWLGDENNPEARVRVPITPTQLLHIDTHCTTPSKMAIVLVDYLFPKEVLATSNLSGKGKHCKKQLDPLMIYGIRSHLFYKFNITEKEWYRIKQNIDSKCRSAWRRKVKGMILGDNKNPMLSSNNDSKMDDVIDKNYILSGPILSEEIAEEGEIESGVLKTGRGHFKIIRATAEQFAKLQESENVVHAFKVLTNEDLGEIGPPSQLFSVEDMDGYTLEGCGKETLTIVTKTGEVNIPYQQHTIFTTEDSLEDDSQFLDT